MTINAQNWKRPDLGPEPKQAFSKLEPVNAQTFKTPDLEFNKRGPRVKGVPGNNGKIPSN